MNARTSKFIFTVLLVAALVVPALAILPSAGAQQEAAGIARVRIGYFAFDPWEIDTLIDGKPVPGGGWLEGMWLSLSWPGAPSILAGYGSTPFLVFPSGIHTFAFVPKGEGLDAAILGPQEVQLEDGHRYSLVVVGDIEDNTLNLLVIDETEVFSEADPGTDYMITLVHDIKGAPPVNFKATSRVVAENLGYGHFSTDWWSGDYQPRYFQVVATGDQPKYLFSFSTGAIPPSFSGLAVLIGSYPGTAGKDYFWADNSWYVGEITVIDGGTVAVGDTISGEIAGFGNRVRYTLTLDADTSLNLYANATGTRTSDPRTWRFDPFLYVYDAQGHSLFWNDEVSLEGVSLDALGNFDAGLEGIDLTAGSYTIEVGAAGDSNTGPYELIVENAVSE